jgi:putative flippase GtrA
LEYSNLWTTISEILGIISVIICVFLWAAFWKIFAKAGQPGWASIIPIYNVFVLLRIVGKPAWWFFLLIIPGVNIVSLIMLTHELSKSFGKGAGFTFGLMVLSFVFYPILGFGGAPYLGPGGTESDADKLGSFEDYELKR